jgi:tryptophan synthase alpha chain
MNAISRIQQLFANHKARAAYLTVGDGGVEKSLQAAQALIKGGVNMLELGIPFSDPIADGPIIQRAAARSLAHGTTLQDVLWLVKAIRKQSDIPLILFSYLNPILSKIASGFFKEAKKAGVDGLLLIDCPLEESYTLRDASLEYDIALIYVITSSTSLTRIRKINAYAQGFLYYACRKGTTGIRNALPDDFKEKIQAIKSIVHLPILVGFGVSHREMAKQVLEEADGVVVGSYFVKALEEGVHPSTLTKLARNIYA